MVDAGEVAPRGERELDAPRRAPLRRNGSSSSATRSAVPSALFDGTHLLTRCVLRCSQWTANGEPDHTGLQYATMVAAIDKVLYLRGWAMQNVWIWADYLSIPQASRGQQKLAIASLVVAA